MKRVQAFVLLFTIIGILSLTGCSGGNKTADSGELLMWLVGAEGQAQTINELGVEFFKKTGIKVQCEAISWGEAHSKYLTSIVGEVTPDIGTMGLTWGAEFGNLGAMVNLAEAFPEDVQEMKTRIFPGIWRSAEECQHCSGKAHGKTGSSSCRTKKPSGNNERSAYLFNHNGERHDGGKRYYSFAGKRFYERFSGYQRNMLL